MLTLSLLGHPTITINEQPIEIRSVKARALFFYLVCEPRPHSRQSLAGLLWGDSPEETARTNLRNQLTKLRAALGDYLLIERRTIAFDNTQPHQLDLSGLTQHASLTDADLAKIAATYRDDFLHDFHVPRAPDFELWQLTLREQLRQQQTTLLRRLAHSDTLDPLSATQFARQWVALNPLEEAAHARTISLLIAQGNHAEARLQLATCRKLFAEELGIEISAETVALLQMGRQGDRETGRKTPPLSISPSPPLPSSLPAATTRFIGRHSELARLGDLLTQDDCRLLTIVGMGGMGKTRLSLELARQLEASGLFSDGVCFVELAGSDGGQADALLLPMIEALKIRPNRNQTPLQALQQHLRNRSLLLVLDNFEHLVEQSGQLVELLTAAPGLKLVTTSRRTLGLYEEWVFELEGLDVASETSTAYELFVHRAQRIYLNFQPIAHQSAIERICQLMDGMPLGIELAASWVRTLTCTEIADRLAENLAALQNSSRNTPSRHLTMQAVFDHSWELLTEGERKLMAGLSVFRGGFMLPAAHAVVDADARSLSELLNRSLLRRTTDGRYSMHELVRQFSAEVTPLQDLNTLRHQHATFFADLLAFHAPNFHGRNETATLHSVLPDEANIRSAWRFAIETAEIGILDQLLQGIDRLMSLRGQFDRCRSLLGEAAPVLNSDAVAPLLRSRFLNKYAHAWQYADRVAEEPRDLLNEARVLAEKIDDAAQLARAHNGLGNCELARGNYDAALAHFERATPLAEQSESFSLLADNLQMTAYLLSRRSVSEATLALIERALDLQRSHGGDIAIASTLTTLGTQYNNLGRHVEAIVVFEEVLERTQALRHTLGIASAHTGLFASSFPLGKLELAAENAEKGLAAYHEAGDQWGVAIAQHNLGSVYAAREMWQQAFGSYRESAETYMAINARNTGLANSQLACADAALQLGDAETAQRFRHDGLALAWKLESLRFVAKGFVSFAKAAIQAGDLERAGKLLAHVDGMEAVSAETQSAVASLHQSIPIPLTSSNSSTEALVSQLLNA